MSLQMLSQKMWTRYDHIALHYISNNNIIIVTNEFGENSMFQQIHIQYNNIINNIVVTYFTGSPNSMAEQTNFNN